MADSYWTKRNLVSRRRFLHGAGMAGAGMALAACGGTTTPAGGKVAGSPVAGSSKTPVAGDAKPVRGGLLTIGMASDVANLDPLNSTLFVDRLVQYQMYNSLLATDKDLKLLPGLALSWETADPLSVVLKLRQGVKFHDGGDLNADAVKFNFDRMLTTPSSPRRTELTGVKSVQAIDPSTVKLVLDAPFSPLLAQLVDRAGMIVSPAAIQKYGAELTRAPLGAGTGPYKFVEYKKDDHINLIRNDAYWDKDAAGAALPYLDRLVYRPIVDNSQRLNSLRTGEIDFADGIPGKDVEAIKKDPTLSYSQAPSLGYQDIALHSGAEPFKDVRVRQALAWSIDRQQVIDTILFKLAIQANGPVAPPHFAYDPAYKPYSRDIAKAKALLQAAGRQTVNFTMMITAGSPEDQ
ncbi:MAG: ABC transporter substrate-binding protein, partial [Dehalococcoidia bacterium]